jgi:hypothetical protein
MVEQEFVGIKRGRGLRIPCPRCGFVGGWIEKKKGKNNIYLYYVHPFRTPEGRKVKKCYLGPIKPKIGRLIYNWRVAQLVRKLRGYVYSFSIVIPSVIKVSILWEGILRGVARCRVCGSSEGLRPYYKLVTKETGNFIILCNKCRWKHYQDLQLRVQSCEVCGAVPSEDVHIDVHHLTRHDYGHAPENFMYLCRRCHKLAHQVMDELFKILDLWICSCGFKTESKLKLAEHIKQTHEAKTYPQVGRWIKDKCKHVVKYAWEV